MDHFNYKDGQLYCENVPAEKIAAEVGTPTYVYSKATLIHHYRQIAESFKPLDATICYSIKSCGNINLCKVLADEGCGFDVTSGGELFRALQAGGDPKKMIYAGVGKTDKEIADAINVGIAAFNLESEEEIENVDRVAGSIGKQAVGAIRVNPDVDAKTHAKTTTGRKGNKFGIDIDRVEAVFERYRNLKNLRVGGVHIHIGSPVYLIQPYVDAVTKMIALIDRLTEKGHKIEWFDVGGGFGVDYQKPGQAPACHRTRESARAVAERQALPHRVRARALHRGANAGILLTRVTYRKQSGETKYVIVDAGMNDLIRPTLYDAYHYIWPVKPDAANFRTERNSEIAPVDGETVDIVGPICESGDYLAKARALPQVHRGDLLSVFTAGAYGFAMASNYNNRPRAAEVLVDGRLLQSDPPAVRRTKTSWRPNDCNEIRVERCRHRFPTCRSPSRRGRSNSANSKRSRSATTSGAGSRSPSRRSSFFTS